MQEPLNNLFTSSKLMILDFQQIPKGIPKEEDISYFFGESKSKKIDPKRAENRQLFNNNFLRKAGVQYAIGLYGENRGEMIANSTIAKEGRTIHLGIDIFCEELETVFVPCDGSIVRSGREPGIHSFGYYLILQPSDRTVPYIFFGHLGAKKIKKGPVKAGQPIAVLGDYKNHENGGWSRHLHIQMLKNLPRAGEVPIGYSSHNKFANSKLEFPDPLEFFKGWDIKS